MEVNWDPFANDFRDIKPSPIAIIRIKRDITDLFKSPAPGICVLPDENDITVIHALISGPMDTPYEGGFFYFVLKCGADYPASPPRARLITTGSGGTRFNPNLYKNGKVCLSILGTWPGPGWSPVLSLGSVLISIQSLMNEQPYFNEPGFENSKNLIAAEQYNNFIRHETLRVAVCGIMKGTEPLPLPFRDLVKASFVEFMGFYENQCKKFAHLEGQTMSEPFEHFSSNSKRFNFSSIYNTLQELKAQLSQMFSVVWK